MELLRARASGSTLLEAVVATAIIALALAIAYPSVSEGIDAARLQGAADQSRLFLLDAQQLADRHRQAVLLRIDPSSSRIVSISEDGRWERVLELPRALRVVAPAKVLEAIMYPGGPLPQLHLALASSRGARSGFRVDPFRGTLEEWGDGN